MNTQELLNILKIVGSTLFGILAMHGYMTTDQASAIMTDLSIAVPALLSAGTMAWSIYAHWNMKKVPVNSVAIAPVNNDAAPITSAPVGTIIVPPAAAKVVGALLAAFLLAALAFPGGARAQSKPLQLRPLTGNVIKDLGIGQSSGVTGAPVTDAQNFFNAQLLPDLQYALKLSQAAKNNITADCYQAWIDIITTQQTAVKNPDGTDIAMPDPHIITEFEKLVELRNALQPESPFMVKCSPVASMVKKDIVGFIGIVISGGAGLATLVPGL